MCAACARDVERRGFSSVGMSCCGCLVGAGGRVLRRDRTDWEIREEMIVAAWSFRWALRVATVFC